MGKVPDIIIIIIIIIIISDFAIIKGERCKTFLFLYLKKC